MGTNVKSNSPGHFEQSILKAIVGVTQVIPATGSLFISGSSSTQKQILAKLQGIVDEYSAVRSAKASYNTVLQTQRNNAGADHEYLMQLHAAVVAAFGRQSPELAKFGFTPGKPRKTTVAKQAEAAAKRQETRKLRGTMGKNEKAGIKAGAQPSPDVIVSNGKVQLANPSGGSEPSANAAATTPPAAAAAAS